MEPPLEVPGPSNSCPQSEQGYRQAVLRHLDQKFGQTIQDCPGCLYNCYMMEENLGVTGKGLKGKILNLLFAVLEIPTIIQMARTTANRPERTTIFTDHEDAGGNT